MMIERYDETAEGCYTHTPLNYDVMYNDIHVTCKGGHVTTGVMSYEKKTEQEISIYLQNCTLGCSENLKNHF